MNTRHINQMQESLSNYVNAGSRHNESYIRGLAEILKSELQENELLELSEEIDFLLEGTDFDINPTQYESQREFSKTETDMMAHNAGLNKMKDGNYTGSAEQWDKFDYLLSSAK
jgi:hypothetical protein